MKKRWRLLKLYVESLHQDRLNRKIQIRNFHVNKKELNEGGNTKIDHVGFNDGVGIYNKYVNGNIEKGKEIEGKGERKNDHEIKKTMEREILKKKKKEQTEQKGKIKGFNLKNLRLFGICFFTSVFCYATLKKVPEGYVCIIENKKDESVSPYIYDDKMTFFYNPLKYKVILMRTIPVQKKYANIYETLDKKKIRVLLEVKMKPKIPFIIEIYKSFGSNYSNSYIEREMNLDIKNTVNQFNYETFFQTESDEYAGDTEKIKNVKKENEMVNGITADDIVDHMIERFYDCSIFHKIHILDVSILFQKVE